MRPSRLRVLTLAAALVGWSGLVAPRLPTRWATPVHAALGAVLVRWTDAPLGLRPPASRSGGRLGLSAAGAVAVAVASATVVPAVRVGMRKRSMPEPVAEWLLVRIPIGTVWSEETAFRAALGTVAAQSFGPRWGRILQAVAFGLSHVADARGAGETVVGTVAVTGVAGWVFGWLYDRSGSLVAPMLAHLAVNEAGAVAALVVQRQGLMVDSPI
ncbi:CPBP family intramembrane metalloprotease [Mycobacterium hodleri]|uniref:Rv0804 family intramembrane glutamic endopeptidase n=1 Tax=Mycolicibacterium hodleri TaxID=49897 RepID=UPI0021F27BA5|nr:CPBP family intramembrane glutamic endopeptidase [Mycolicibacterium hodleri]MCV7134849.1 CPBP family intramembrane metalloprotease [Mycolicibacterium hodleri]